MEWWSDGFRSTIPFLMIVLVTGGTGFVGRELVRELHGAGHSLRLLVRHPNSPAAQETATRFAAEVREGNVLDAASLPGALRGADAVIHLVGIISEAGEQTFENVHARATENMIASARRAGVKRFLQDRKSTRLNSSHTVISYAVFCLKKKNKK